MSFGPFKLVNVRISYDNLVLDLANEDGEILYSPKRKLRYGQSDEAKRHAEGLIGSLVTTETYDPIKWPSTQWWLSVSRYSEKLSPVLVEAQVQAQLEKFLAHLELAKQQSLSKP